MSLQQIISNNIADNPIQRLENILLNRQRGKWFRRIMYLLTAFVLAIPLLWGFGRQFHDALNFSLGVMVLLNITVFIFVVLRAVQIGSDSMYRERRNRTWELLMLTGVSNWRVVMGKWIGIMRHLMRDYFWLYIVRFGTMFWLSVSHNLTQDYTYWELNRSFDSFVTVLDGRIDPTWFVISISFALLLTILEIAFSSAIGLSVAFFKFRTKTASVIAVAVRIGFALIIPVMTYLAFSVSDGEDILIIDAYNIDESIAIFAGRASTFFADNGMISAAMYSNQVFTIEMGDDEYVMAFQLANFLGILMYLSGTAIALGIAANRAFVRGVDYSNGIQPKIKRKRTRANQQINFEQRTLQESGAFVVQANSQNIFNFDNADTLSVDIHYYQRRLGRMILRVSGDDSPKFVQLSNVAYMEAPAFWKGANFKTASEADYQAFVQEKGIYVNSLVEESMRLYVLEGKSTVKIIAGTAQILDYLPDNL